MKRIISLLLALCVITGTVPRIDRTGIIPIAESPCPAPGPALAGFVIGVTVVAAGVVWYIWVKLKAPAPGGIYYWALEKSMDHVNWTPVATNSLRMFEEKAWDCFEVQRNSDKIAFWRMRCLGATIFTNYVNIGFTTCGNEQVRPIIQP